MEGEEERGHVLTGWIKKVKPAEETEKRKEKNQEKAGSWKPQKENVLRGELGPTPLILLGGWEAGD